MRPIRTAAVLALMVSYSAGVEAQVIVEASPDVTIEIGSGNERVDDHEVSDGVSALDPAMSLSFSGVPDEAALSAYGTVLGSEAAALSFESDVELPGGVLARKGDVVEHLAGTYTVLFDASAEGVPEGAITDAIARDGDDLLLSFDTTVDLGGGVIADDADLVRFDGSGFAIELDASALGFDLAVDLDAASRVEAGRYALSFDTSGTIDGIAFQDEDVLLYDQGVWSLLVDGDAEDARWAASDVDAVFVPEPGASALLLSGGLLLFRLRRRRAARSSAYLRALQGRAHSSQGDPKMSGVNDRVSNRSAQHGVERALLLVALVTQLLLPGIASAVDGVIEINQTCAVNGGCTAGDTPGFPVTIPSPGSYRLTSVLTTGGGTQAILFDARRATLDLNGFGVNCNASSTVFGEHCIGLSATAPQNGEGNVVRNGVVRGGGDRAISLGEQSRVEEVRVESAPNTGLFLGTGGVVERCSVYDNLGNGIEVGAGGTVRDSSSHGNTFTGITGGRAALITGNASYENGGNGIFGSFGAMISNNAVSQNGAVGIDVSTSGMITENNVYSNDGDGIEAGVGTLVMGNSVRSNGGFGLDLNVNAGYRANVIDNNTAGTVNAGENLLGNMCNGAQVCP